MPVLLFLFCLLLAFINYVINSFFPLTIFICYDMNSFISVTTEPTLDILPRINYVFVLRSSVLLLCSYFIRFSFSFWISHLNHVNMCNSLSFSFKVAILLGFFPSLFYRIFIFCYHFTVFMKFSLQLFIFSSTLWDHISTYSSMPASSLLPSFLSWRICWCD